MIGKVEVLERFDRAGFNVDYYFIELDSLEYILLLFRSDTMKDKTNAPCTHGTFIPKNTQMTPRPPLIELFVTAITLLWGIWTGQQSCVLSASENENVYSRMTADCFGLVNDGWWCQSFELFLDLREAKLLILKNINRFPALSRYIHPHIHGFIATEHLFWSIGKTLAEAYCT